jgi:hypothetical protein
MIRAARAFRRHPHSLGEDAKRLAAAKQWLIGRGVNGVSVEGSPSDYEPPFGVRNDAWLSGALL